MRKLWVLLAVVVGFVAACGGESELDLVSSVANAADTTLSASSARVSTHTEIAGQSTDFEGVYDFANQRARLVADGTSFGMSGETEFLYDFADRLLMYIGLPEAEAAQVGASWLEMDLGAAMADAGIDADLAEIIQSQSSDPTAGLQFLRGASEVVEVGTEELRGVETRHLEVTIDLQKLVTESPEAIRDDIAKLVDLYRVDTVQIELWLDDDNRVRRFVQVIDYDDLDIPGADQDTLAGRSVSTDTEYYDFGVATDIVLPDADDTISFQELMAQFGG